MIDHTGIGAAEMARSAGSDDAALGASGLRPVAEMPEHQGTDGAADGNNIEVMFRGGGGTRRDLSPVTSRG